MWYLQRQDLPIQPEITVIVGELSLDGAINAILGHAGLDNVSWFSDWATSFSANVITNTWLGFPFMMVIALGGLQSIPDDLYEAADVDGASKWFQFWNITAPLLRPGSTIQAMLALASRSGASPSCTSIGEEGDAGHRAGRQRGGLNFG